MDEVSDFLPDGDGIELLTGYTPVPDGYTDDVVSVHLPYATDWYGIWNGTREVPDDLSESDIRFIYYGADKSQIIKNIVDSIGIASVLEPEYGVMHAGSANLDELLRTEYSDDPSKVLSSFAEIMNDVVSEFPNGEPPFRLLFENQWWPGLQMLDAGGYRLLEKKIEFENWGLCLDTGHLLISAGGSKSESESIDTILDIVGKYPQDMLDSIMTMHLHCNTSYGILSRPQNDDGFSELSVMDRLSAAYAYICSVDTHRPFTDERAAEIAEAVNPLFLTHEMGASDGVSKGKDYLTQRELFR